MDLCTVRWARVDTIHLPRDVFQIQSAVQICLSHCFYRQTHFFNIKKERASYASASIDAHNFHIYFECVNVTKTGLEYESGNTCQPERLSCRPPERPGRLHISRCLGLLPYSCCSHYHRRLPRWWCVALSWRWAGAFSGKWRARSQGRAMDY